MKTIDEVIARMDQIVAECKSKSSRIGYFAILYRQVTIRIKNGILNSEFEDNPRMEKLDVLFAKRFIDAYDTYQSGQKPTASWIHAFKAAESSKHLVLQHLLLGINSHINLDLGIAAVETIDGGDLISLQNDFNKINAVLAELVDSVKSNVGTMSPFFHTIIRFAKGKEEILVNFSIKLARDGAWRFARKYQTAEDKADCIQKRDKAIAILAKGLTNPGIKLRMWVWLIGLAEWKSVPEIMEQLNMAAEATIPVT
ncbi:DUF5995 family protein [Aquiflexum sp. TKW24L]|uniref:DUF5995 family protein n=1 Tax=Aquiflexum sp. TKW24L TaxID=2942212 RepID=UPI0020C1510F|nr:DUF5995 family protein [Aquiflexum sp. TKW24L]MCL6260296.1 DUF5995 family protein [Aquiflexum sp. TKW24L]